MNVGPQSLLNSIMHLLMHVVMNASKSVHYVITGVLTRLDVSFYLVVRATGMTGPGK